MHFDKGYHWSWRLKGQTESICIRSLTPVSRWEQYKSKGGNRFLELMRDRLNSITVPKEMWRMRDRDPKEMISGFWFGCVVVPGCQV